MARAAFALSAPHQSRNAPAAVLPHEWEAAVTVWVDLPLGMARTRRVSAHISALQERLASLQVGEVRHG